MLELHFQNPVAILLSLVPALLSWAITAYGLAKLPKQPLTWSFLMLTFGLACVQSSDALARMSGSAETAVAFATFLGAGSLLIGPGVLHFALFFSGREKWALRRGLILFLYVPALFFNSLQRAGAMVTEQVFQEGVGFIAVPVPSFANTFFALHLAVGVLGGLGVLLHYAYKMRNDPERRMGAYFVAGGALIPGIQGTGQVILQNVLGWVMLPLATLTISIFVVGCFIALTRYKALNIAPKVSATTVLETSPDIIVIAGPRGNLRYVNATARKVLGLAADARFDDRQLRELFGAGAGYGHFQSEVWERVRRRETVVGISSTFASQAGESIPVSLAVAPVPEAYQEEPSILVMARDVSAVQRITDNLRAMVTQMVDMGAQTGEIVVALRSSATQLSSVATEQVAALTETANTTTEMAQTSAVSADRAAELIQQGDSARAVVDEGRQRAEAAVESMRAISTSLGKIASASSTLAEKVQRIDGIIETVTFLADQSSTLAINAGIEASRAGEAGRGFAAVAREMRSLASDSRKAAIQVREMLGEIRQKTVQTDGYVAAGTATVEEGNKLVGRLGEVVEQLGVTVNEAVGLMRQVEGSARQHQVGVSQVNEALTNMRTASASIRDGARMLSDLSERAHSLSSTLTSAGDSRTTT